MIISGKNLVLAHMELAHVPIIYSMYLSGKYSKFFLTDFITMDRIAELQGNVYAILDKSNPSVLLGFCSYKIECEPSRRFSIAVAVDEKYQNKKIGVAATTLFLWHVFNNLNFYKCKAIIRSDNEPSIKGVTKIGFFPVGKLKDEYFMNGQFWDAKIFELTKRNFNEQYKDLNSIEGA